MEARDAERRPFSDREPIRSTATAQTQELRSQIEILEHRRLEATFMGKEPLKMEGPDAHEHKRELTEAKENLSIDQGLRREIDGIRQEIVYARTDYQES